MLRIVSFACAAMLLLLIAKPQGDRFSKYKTIEAYEVRPGILMVPKYSDDGQVCEIGLERLHNSPEGMSLDSGLSRKEIDQIADELVPANERGPKPNNLLAQGTTDFVGSSMVTSEEYKNVSIRIYGPVLPTSSKHEIVETDIVAKILWINRKCQ